MEFRQAVQAELRAQALEREAALLRDASGGSSLDLWPGIGRTASLASAEKAAVSNLASMAKEAREAAAKTAGSSSHGGPGAKPMAVAKPSSGTVAKPSTGASAGSSSKEKVVKVIQKERIWVRKRKVVHSSPEDERRSNDRISPGIMVR